MSASLYEKKAWIYGIIITILALLAQWLKDWLLRCPGWILTTEPIISGCWVMFVKAPTVRELFLVWGDVFHPLRLVFSFLFLTSVLRVPHPGISHCYDCVNKSNTYLFFSGKMCSLIGFVETLIPVIYIPIYSKLFSNTIETFPGAVYILGGTMTIPAFLVFM